MLKPLQPQKEKYHKFYKEISESVAEQSCAEIRKVGAVIVLPTGLIATGWNGTPAGFPNDCEEWDSLEEGAVRVTKPEVIHAERNALDKLTRQGMSAEGAILFVTTAPCIECAKSISTVGIREVHYRDVQSNIKGLNYLKEAAIPTFKY